MARELADDERGGGERVAVMDRLDHPAREKLRAGKRGTRAGALASGKENLLPEAVGAWCGGEESGSACERRVWRELVRAAARREGVERRGQAGGKKSRAQER